MQPVMAGISVIIGATSRSQIWTGFEEKSTVTSSTTWTRQVDCITNDGVMHQFIPWVQLCSLDQSRFTTSRISDTCTRMFRLVPRMHKEANCPIPPFSKVRQPGTENRKAALAVDVNASRMPGLSQKTAKPSLAGLYSEIIVGLLLYVSTNEYVHQIRVCAASTRTEVQLSTSLTGLSQLSGVLSHLQAHTHTQSLRASEVFYYQVDRCTSNRRLTPRNYRED